MQEGTRQLDALRAKKTRSDIQQVFVTPALPSSTSRPVPLPSKPGKVRPSDFSLTRPNRIISPSPASTLPGPPMAMGPPPIVPPTAALPHTQVIDGVTHYYHQVPVPGCRKFLGHSTGTAKGAGREKVNVISSGMVRSAAEEQAQAREDYQRHIEQQQREIRLARERNTESRDEFEQGSLTGEKQLRGRASLDAFLVGSSP